jgi:hypothetical protein
MAIIDKTQVKKQRGEDFRSGAVGLKDVKLCWAKVHEPDLKFKSDEKEYSVVVFMSEEDKDFCENELLLNKQYALVGKTKRKGKIVYPVESQVDEGKFHYGEFEGLWGVKLTCPEFDKKGNKLKIDVYDKDGKPTDALIGNGSEGLVRLYTWQSQDGMLNTRLNGIRVTNLVEYESDGEGGFDDILGVERPKRDPDMDFGDDVPFEIEDESDDLY